MTLNPEATNRMTCSKCGWTRIVDHMRPYRGGHTHPETGAECHEMLVYEEVSPLPVEVAILGEDRPMITDLELTNLTSKPSDEDPEAAAAAREKAQQEVSRRADLLKRIEDEVYNGPGAAMAQGPSILDPAPTEPDGGAANA